MRFQRRQAQTPLRKHAVSRSRSRLGRPKTLEMLEGRVLLAGDIAVASSPWQNPLAAADVNHDLRITPRDALVVINDLLAHGSHDLAQALPQTAGSESQSAIYLDVNGDNRVTPRDLLMVVNELVATKLAQVHTYATDLNGNVITSINVGSNYILRSDVQDIRSDVPQNSGGVFSASVDTSYNSTLSAVAGSLVIDPYYNLLPQGSASTPGLIDDAGGATTSGSAPGRIVQKLWSIQMTASAAGTQSFMPSQGADEWGLFTGDAHDLTADEIDFIGSTLQIISTETLSISTGNIQQVEGNAGQSAFVFTVSLSAVAAQPVTVNYGTSDGTATTAGNDYVAANGTITFQAGITSQVVTVLVNGDTTVEPNETFNLTLTNPSSNAVINVGTGVATITNDDTVAALTLGIAPVTVQNVTSGTTSAVFTVSLSAASGSQVTVAYTTANGSAVAGTDYVATSGTLTFSPGAVTQTIPVTIIGDPNPDDTDIFFVNLSNPVGATLSNTQTTGTILPAVTAPAISVSGAEQVEGDVGNTALVFTVSLAAASTQNATVVYATSDGTATTANSDYVATSGTLVFVAGQTTRTVTVQLVGDLAPEGNETFLLNVAAVSGATGSVQGIGTIVDDDGPPTIVIANTTVSAGASLVDAIFTVTISGKVLEPVTVGYATANGTATAGQDYLARTGILTFNPGGPSSQTITVPVLGSQQAEDDKTFFVNLSSPSPPTVIIGDDSAIGTIITQGLSVVDLAVAEGNAGTTNALFTVNLSRAVAETVTVAYTTVDGTATTAGSDYLAASGVLTFAPGVTSQVVTVQILGDTLVEANETFALQLSNAVGAPIFNSTGTATILNDDGAKVAVRLVITDTAGNPLSANQTLEINDAFRISVFVSDVQADPESVFQAFVDVLYQSGLAQVTGPIVYGPDFPIDHQGSTATPGLIDEAGGFATAQPASNLGAERLLFSVPFKAIDVGLLNFTIGPATLPDNGIFVFGSDNPVPPAEVNFVGDSVNIGANVFTVNNATVTEGDSGTKELVFTVSRFLPNGNPATVQYATSNGTATAGQDYVATSGTLTFLPGGPTSQTVTVLINGDTIDENDEDFFLVLSNAQGATNSNAPGVGTIIDDDGPTTVSVTGGTANEGQALVFTINLPAPSGKTVTVAYATADSLSGSKAVAGIDYTPVSGVLTFAPGTTQQTVTVQTLSDIVIEGNETFRLVLTNPVNATLGTAAATGTIVDVPPAGIFGSVYVDLNNNGVRDPNETGIANVTVTAKRVGGGFSQSTLTTADGTYSLLGLIPGTYTLVETQPGFFADGRDTRFGVESPTNDQFGNIVLVASGSSSGYNFGERGMRSDFLTAFLNRRALFASAVVTGYTGAQIGTADAVLSPKGGDIWISFDGGWSGLRTIQALFNGDLGSASMKLYNNDLQEVAVSAPNSQGASIIYSAQPGQNYFLRLSGTNPTVTLQISDTVLMSNLTATPSTGSSSSGSGGSSSTDATTPVPVTTSSRFASALVVTADESEPLAGANAADEALAEDEDWLLDSSLLS